MSERDRNKRECELGQYLNLHDQEAPTKLLLLVVSMVARFSNRLFCVCCLGQSPTAGHGISLCVSERLLPIKTVKTHPLVS